MRKKSWMVAMVFVFCVLMFLVSGCKNNKILRSADPDCWWVKWQSGVAEVGMPALRDGKASHNLSPAEIIYYSAVENGSNPILIMAYLESQRLLSENISYGDFELRLRLACNYGGAESKWGGFYPQLIGTSYQIYLWRDRNTDFATAYASFPAGEIGLDEFKVIYADLVQQMNVITKDRGNNFSTELTQDSYDDFISAFGPNNIQQLLEELGSPLKDPKLFQEESINDSVDYSAVCQ